jgi:hypothetical protein
VPHLRAADEALGPLRLAIRERHEVRLAYRNGEGVASQRVVWPLGLFFWGDRPDEVPRAGWRIHCMGPGARGLTPTVLTPPYSWARRR